MTDYGWAEVEGHGRSHGRLIQNGPATPFLDDLNAAVHTACTMPRVRFEVGLGDVAESWIKKKHADGAVHEPATIAAFLAVRQRFPHCKTIFDAGAHFGYFSLLADALFENAEVTAFEMHPGILPVLQRNVGPSVRCVHAVLSDEIKAGTLFWLSAFNIFAKPAGGWEALQADPAAMKQRGANNRGRGFARLDVTTLDQYCAATTPPDLIKIDVEGYQAKAIRGGIETFRRHRPIVIVELHDPEKLARFGTTNKDTVQPLFDLSYRGFWCGNHRSRDARFKAVDAMGERHEKLSIMVMVPGERL